jgi:hypothetical protein
VCPGTVHCARAWSGVGSYGEMTSQRTVSPRLDELEYLRTPLNPGEGRVLRALCERLPEGWEIYIQPHLNGLRPDFVLLHPRVGISVLEVKDWDLDAMPYQLRQSADGHFRLTAYRAGRWFPVEEPMQKLERYRQEISKLYCPSLKPGGLRAVTGCLVLPSAPTHQAQELLDPARTNLGGAAQRLTIGGADSLCESGLLNLLPDLARTSSGYMTPEVAAELRDWLAEPDFSAEQRDRPPLDRDQFRLATTRTAVGYRRVWGPAGSGKTLVIAARAGELQREGKDVLVVSYNITLLNYLRDTAKRFGADVNQITWLHFHYWCKRTMETGDCAAEYKALWPKSDASSVLREGLPSATIAAIHRGTLADQIPRYDAILVDEGQDFLPAWWDALRLVLRDQGEALLVVDASQDIYDAARSWDESTTIRAGFSGRPAVLRTSYRLPIRLAELARSFAEEYLPATARVLPEPDATQQLTLDVQLRWRQVDEARVPEVVVEELLALDGVPYADRVFVVDRTEVGRAVSMMLRQLRINVIGTFDPDWKTQRRQKLYFFKGSEKIKGTTIDSFKGWEGRAIVVCLSGRASPQLTYTALTRLKTSDSGSHLTVVCADPRWASFGSTWG